MQLSERFVIRPMQPHDLDLAIEWAATEGWNPGLHDAEAFHTADPEGFFLGLLDGQPVAAVSGVRYGEHYGFIGLFIVLPEYRDKTYGWRIGQAALSRLAGRTIGIDGVVAHQSSYQRLGFAYAHRNVRYQGEVAAAGSAVQSGIVALADRPFDEILAYDRSCFPEVRNAFLQRWIDTPGGCALGWMHQDRLAGYAVARPCREGFKIGPLFADSATGAEALLSGLLNRLPAGQTFFLDVPQTNPAAVALAESRGMQMVFETARMYRGPAPDLPIGHIFGITSFELG